MSDIRELTDLAGKKVLVRIDTDVEVVHGRVLDDYRLKAALPTIRYLRHGGASLTLVGHSGRPKGKAKAEFSLLPIAKRLAQLLVPGSRPRLIRQEPAESPVFATTYQLAKDVVLLENLRFDVGEEESEPEFIQLLARGQDAFVNESFATAHRAAASTVGVAKKLPSYAGLRMVDEVAHLSLVLHQPQRPVCLIVGGAKMEEKLGLLDTLLPKVDHVLTGGVVANMLLKVRGVDIKDSLTEPSLQERAEKLLDGAYADKILLPVDYVWQADRMVDLGPATVAAYNQIISDSQTIFWAGSLGKAEEEKFAVATKAIAERLAKHTGIRIVGGGDTAASLQRLNLLNKMSFVSTGGGAALEFLAGQELPGLEVLN